MTNKTQFCLLLLFVYSSLSAQISFKTEYFGTSSYWFQKGEKPRERVGKAEGSAIVYQGVVNIPLSMKINENNQPTVWGVGLSGTYASLNNHNFTEDLVIPEIMNLETALYHVRPLNNKWSLMVSAGIGLYTPFASLSRLQARHILGSMSSLFICRIKPNFELGGGIAINSAFGYPMAFPALYLNWNLQGKFDINISMTSGLNINAGIHLNKYLTLSWIAEMNGQTALLKKEGKNVIFTHQYIVTGFCTEIKINRFISIPFTAGINANRPAYFTDRTLKAMFTESGSYYFQVSPYAAGGVTLNF